MNEIEITFKDFKAKWKVCSHRPAQLWFKLFMLELQENEKFNFRFTGFLNNSKNTITLLEAFRRNISVINADGRYYISEMPNEFNQDIANKIHHHFEILSGSFERPSEYFLNSSIDVQNAIAGLNYCIHDLEAYARNEEHSGTEQELQVFSTLVTEIKECRRTIIPGSFYPFFTMHLDFGDMVLHYGQIGKTWLEAFYDDDKEVFKEGIRPQYALSGEFDILFGKLIPDEKYMSKLTTFLKTNGKDINDISLRLGHLPIAKLNASKDEWKLIKDEIGRCAEVSQISVYTLGKKVFTKTFPKGPCNQE